MLNRLQTGFSHRSRFTALSRVLNNLTNINNINTNSTNNNSSSTKSSFPNYTLHLSRSPTSKRRSKLAALDAHARALTAPEVRPTTTTMSTRLPSDPSSQSNFQEVKVTHSSYELDVDFERRVVEGQVLLHATCQVSAPPRLTLDTRDLTIHSVTLHAVQPGGTAPEGAGVGAPGTALEFQLGEQHPVLGTPLHVALPASLSLAPGAVVVVGVRFTTSPSCSAMQFLEPRQTAGGQQPYMFTQCQAIHARSLVPCQDSPGAKMSYRAVVRVPQPLTALMSAVQEEGEGGQPPAFVHLASLPAPRPANTFAFVQKVPIPPYLIALAAGELVSADLGGRTRVWSEPSMVAAGAAEFAETAKFLEAGEAIAGPYVWGRYDLLLLPPSFPYGGMENPCLTFVTPTLLAGDRSLTNVVAHEIAHSWTGNLVTNATWEHFWLNEGFTVFLERKILGRLHGPAAFQFAAARGAAELAAEVERLGADHPHTRLVPELAGGVDPDEVFSKIPYEKGFYFLYYLQELVGGAAAFEPFLAAYIAAHSDRPLTSYQFKDYFCDYFKEVPAASSVDWSAWFHTPGMPPATNSYDTTLAEAAYDLALKWHTCDVMGIGGSGCPPGASPADVAGWSADQMVAFLERLKQYRALTPLHTSVSQKLAEMYGIYDSQNSEIRFAFFRLAIPAEDPTALPAAAAMLRSQGRMKFLRPLYRALAASKTGRQLAYNTFAEVGPSYHPIAQKMVAADLGLSA